MRKGRVRDPSAYGGVAGVAKGCGLADGAGMFWMTGGGVSALVAFIAAFQSDRVP